MDSISFFWLFPTWNTVLCNLSCPFCWPHMYVKIWNLSELLIRDDSSLWVDDHSFCSSGNSKVIQDARGKLWKSVSKISEDVTNTGTSGYKWKDLQLTSVNFYEGHLVWEKNTVWPENRRKHVVSKLGGEVNHLNRKLGAYSRLSIAQDVMSRWSLLFFTFIEGHLRSPLVRI